MYKVATQLRIGMHQIVTIFISYLSSNCLIVLTITKEP